MNSVDNAISNLKDILTSCLAESANMFSGNEVEGRAEMLRDLKTIVE